MRRWLNVIGVGKREKELILNKKSLNQDYKDGLEVMKMGCSCGYCGKLIGDEYEYDLGDMEFRFCSKECKEEFNKKLHRLRRLGITLNQQTSHGFAVVEESPDDLILYRGEKPILKISLPKQSTQWNIKLP